VSGPSGDHASGPSGQRAIRSAGALLLSILAGLSALLLAYEALTLVNSVWRPLLANPQSLQTDFHYYYEAAVRFMADRSRLYLATDDVIAGFAYPPPAIVPFVWLAKWPLGTALLALSIASYLVLAASLQHWIRFLRRNGYAIDRAGNAAILLIVLALGPAYMNAIFGQVNAFVLASAIVFSTMAVAAPMEAGLVLAAGAWLKVYPVLLAAIGFWDRRTWRALGWALAAVFGIAILLLPLVPLESYAAFFGHVLPTRADKTAIHITNQSLVAFLERFSYPSAKFLNWTGEQAVTVGPAVRAINALSGAAAIVWFARRSRQGESIAAAAGMIALIAVIAPLGWGHTYVMVLPLVILHLAVIRDASPVHAIVVFICIAALMIPAGRLLPFNRMPEWLLNVLYSRYLLATIVLMGLTRATTRRI
jgi:hypothetical protein